ncbi:LacI family DNA-binding transcriptional regulator [Xanthobacteraceae bacterium Astr-EGSB]|uniref:LacI family DNA-binding transcriptional regulator n=1 Tax=Astrobacterium formosum TaxID=3069710 RepID=UPI0027B22A61|nr:LacI family DNA-binding transcriptional regulator [Xanthobacteraceae bacterium Astr-EGSB]
MPTLTDIAKLAGVSRSTVSLVLRESPLVAEATRERVLSMLESSGYVYNRHAANLRSVRTDTVGLIVSDFTNPYYAELLAGAESVLEDAGRVSFLTHTEESLPRQERFLRRMLEQRVDGVVISAASGTGVAALQPFQDAGIPVVQVLRAIDAERFDYVSGDNRLGLRYATEHLIDLGHRRVGYLGTSVKTSVSHDRRLGYADALLGRGIEPDAELMRECLPVWSEAKAATLSLLALPEPPTALACFNDLIALGAMLAVSESGRQPGRDLAVVGFDDIQLASAWRPGLTTIAVRPREIGREAGNLLLERINGSTRSPQSVLLPPRLVIRESCGASLRHEVP